jgi:acetyl-CoA synthetase
MMTFAQARAFLLAHRTDYATAFAGFAWPAPSHFNWALDWFDGELAHSPESCDRIAVWLVDAVTRVETKRSFSELSRSSNQVANFFRDLGLKRRDPILVLLGNDLSLWETMLAAMKLGAVIIPATTLLTADELRERLERSSARFVVASSDQAPKFSDTHHGDLIRVAAGGEPAPGWRTLTEAARYPEVFEAEVATREDEPMLLYFTSGTTAKPKLVSHSHRSYPVGALSTMYWLGLQPGDVHLNISSPGWAKHAWSSMFAPWNAGATVFVVNQPRFDAKTLMAVLEHYPVTTLCAPPTVWRQLIQQDLGACRTSLREVCGAGEPLNPEVIERVRAAWGLTIRDGYGQTETTAQVANSPGQTVKTGAMGRPLPGYEIRLLDADGNEAQEGEVCVVLGSARPAGLMQGYRAEQGNLVAVDGDVYCTGDVAFRDSDGYLTFVGRADDLFKSSGHRISPFELESVLIAHPAVTEAAVVPSPDPVRLSIPKAYVTLAAGIEPSRETAISIFRFTQERLAPYKRIRLIEFVPELPKTISGKIRRVQLRRREVEGAQRDGVSFAERDLPKL